MANHLKNIIQRRIIPQKNDSVSNMLAETCMEWQHTPAYDIRNAKCNGLELFRKNNNLWNRGVRWFKEPMYVVENNKMELFITICTVAILIITIYISISCMYNDFTITVHPPDSKEYNENELKKLQTLHNGLSLYGKLTLAGLSTAWATWCLFKRTTKRCNSGRIYQG